MRLIPLTKNRFALVDAADFDWLMQWKWYAYWCQGTKSYYAGRSKQRNKKKENVLMHRQILGLKRGDKREGDHIHHNTLDNRRSQLRIVSRCQNQWNLRNIKGYSLDKRLNKYLAAITVEGTYVYLGRFESPEEAGNAYKKAKEAYHSFKGYGKSKQAIKSMMRSRPSTIRGYYWHSTREVYRSSIRVLGKDHYLGSFATAKEARNAYLTAKEKYYGKDFRP